MSTSLQKQWPVFVKVAMNSREYHTAIDTDQKPPFVRILARRNLSGLAACPVNESPSPKLIQCGAKVTNMLRLALSSVCFIKGTNQRK